MNTPLVTLPEREEMLKRLLEIENDADIVACFYPLLLEYANERMAPTDVVGIIQNAIGEYGKSLPSEVSNLLSLNIHLFIEALLPDETACREATGFFREIVSSAKNA